MGLNAAIMSQLLQSSAAAKQQGGAWLGAAWGFHQRGKSFLKHFHKLSCGTHLKVNGPRLMIASVLDTCKVCNN